MILVSYNQLLAPIKALFMPDNITMVGESATLVTKKEKKLRQ
jgi:hypothetical protein